MTDSATSLRFAQNDQGQQREFMRKSEFFGKLMNLTKLRVLKFIVSHPSCHSARRTSLSGVAESKIGFEVKIISVA